MAVQLIQFRRGQPSPSFVLRNGEPGWDSSSKVLKIGDGSTQWSQLRDLGSFDLDPEALQEAVDAFLTAHPVSTGMEWVQSVPLAEWAIPHNLGRKPNVAVYIDDEEWTVPVLHTSSTSVTVQFSEPRIGSAVLT